MTQPAHHAGQGAVASAEAKAVSAVRTGGAWYFVVTVFSGGLLVAIPFWHAWSRLRRPKLRNLALLYTLLDVYLVVLVALTPDPATHKSVNDVISTIGGFSVLAIVIPACIQLRRIRRSVYAASPVVALDEDPAVARVLAARRRREEARKIWETDPGMAHELGIGRPDLTRGFDDGGLVDLNSAPASVIASVCGIDQRHTDAIVKARDARGGQYYNLDELFVDVSLPEDAERPERAGGGVTISLRRARPTRRSARETRRRGALHGPPRRKQRHQPVSLRTLAATDGEGTEDVGKHLLDETAEFKMPNLGRHAADDNDGLEETQRWDPGFSRKPPVPGPQDARDR